MRGPGFESRLGQHFFFMFKNLLIFPTVQLHTVDFYWARSWERGNSWLKSWCALSFSCSYETKQSSNCLWPWVKPYLHQKVSCLALCIYISKLGLLLQTQFNFQTQTEISLQIKVIKTTMILTIFVHFLRVLSSSIELFLWLWVPFPHC